MAEPWVNITEEKVKTRLGQREYIAVTSGAVTSGAERPLTQAIRAAVQSVRGYVISSSQNSIGPDGYVPPELETEALLLVVEDLSTRLPTAGILIDENRKQALDRAYRKLRDVQDCKFRITQPETTAVTSPIPDAGSWGGEVRIDMNPYSTRTLVTRYDS